MVVSKKWREIDTLLLHSTNRKYHMAYRFVPFTMIYDDLIGHSPKQNLLSSFITPTGSKTVTYSTNIHNKQHKISYKSENKSSENHRLHYTV